MEIVGSDAFLDMPKTAQLLYFHLCMRADDDGFMGNINGVTRLIGCQEEDLKALLAKRFLIKFKSGIIVIKHWRMHNTIKNDRYHPTVYQEEFKLLTMKENKSYTEINKALVPERNQDGTKMEPEKKRKEKKDIVSKADSPHHKIFEYFVLEVKRQYAVEPAINGGRDGKLVKAALIKHGEEKVKKIIEYYLQSDKCKEFGFNLSVALSAHTVNKYLQDNEALV